MDQIIKPYQGTEKYIFISYAHRDSEKVLPIISKLHFEGYRVWYDEGIDPGTEWDVYISRRVKSCGYMMAFVSKNYFNSKNCRDELKLAGDKDKPVLLVHLEKVELPEGIDLRFGRSQFIQKYKYKRESDFYDKLFEADGISVYLDKVKPVVTVTTEYISSTTNRIVKKKYINGVYEGEIDTNGQRAGYGKFTWLNGNLYEGDWKNNQRHGKGKYICKEKKHAFLWFISTEKIESIYEGDWENDKKHGIGKQTSSNGSVYEGKWKDGLRFGRGKETWKNGNVYEGDYICGVRSGKGKYVWKNGDMYVGDFINGKRAGLGNFNWSNGDYYIGTFVNDKFGTGTLYNSFGRIIATYSNGVKSKIK